MTIYLPVGGIAIFIALYFFYSISRKNQLRKEERQERLKERQEELLTMLKNRNKDSDKEQNESH
jgi:hypothetical protein